MRWCCHAFSGTSFLLQLQNKDRILGTHGAGLIKHQSMSTVKPGSSPNLPHGISQFAPAADLFKTKVHEGLGTNASDPYFRTLPNQESAPPESSVLQPARASAPTREEAERLPTKWGTMQYWLGDSHPRLPLYLEQLVVPHALPVSPAAGGLIAQFEAQVPAFLSDQPKGAQGEMLKLWSTAVDAYDTLSSERIFSRPEFEADLQKLHTATLAAARDLSTREEPLMALEVLRRRAVLRRNKLIQERLMPLVKRGGYFGYGDGVWRVFFNAVERNRPRLFGKEENRLLGFAWDAIMNEDEVRTPSVTACVALYLTLLSIVYSPELAAGESPRASSNNLDKWVDPTRSKLRGKSFALISPIRKRKFVELALRRALESAQGSANLSKILRSRGMHELSREAALCEAIIDNRRAFEADAVSIASRFNSTAEVKTLLSFIVGGTNEAARSHVARTFGIPLRNTSVDWDRVFAALDWATNWHRLAIELLTDTTTLITAHKLVKNAIGHKGTGKHIFNKEYEEELQQVIAVRHTREASKATKISTIVSKLASFQNVDLSLEILGDIGVSTKELEEEASALERQLRTELPTVEIGVLKGLLEAVGKRHPTWLQSGVLPSPQVDLDAPVRGLEMMVRMFVRLAYVPQTGAASIAQHTRRRIGAIGKESYQYNVPAEMGFVEQYDNLQYKRYDWQGWYQRMVDVHNRNVSIRCRIDYLKRLDNHGAPLVDLQTERRLRILAAERVGMGVLKLDSNKYEDQSDNITYGTNKLSELLAESRKAQLGQEYWPTVEVKVRKPSGQTQAYHSALDSDRIELRSKELYEKYRDAKKRNLFVTPMDMWLEIKGMQARKVVKDVDSEGYTVGSLQDILGDD